MAEEGKTISSGLESAPAVSFTFHKKLKPVRVKPTSQEPREEKDLVFSLVGRQIER